MAVLVTSEVKGSMQGYEAVAQIIEGQIRNAQGFVIHAAHAVPGGWRTVEIWATKDDADRFFTQCVSPNLSTGSRPERRVQELHNLLGP